MLEDVTERAGQQNAAPTDAAIRERAWSMLNEAMFTVALQCRRLRTSEPEDGTFVFVGGPTSSF